MTITEERRKVIDFSDPYFDATQAMLVKTGKAYKSLDDLRGRSSASRRPPPVVTTPRSSRRRRA
ncbi:transporter substrate-binding domain-containing protein [Micromonospora sp. M12]